MYFYRVAGLAVVSEIALPGLIVRPAGGEPAAVIIRRAAVPDVLEGASMVRPTFQIAGEHFLLRIAGVARFLLTGGREIVFACENGTAAADVAIFLIGTVFGILLHQREQIVLHASAVRVGGRAVLFCGPSGAGKSTLAAALGQRGYAMVTDDVCAIAMGPDQTPLVQPDGRQFKLWAQAIEKLDLGASAGAPVRGRIEKFYVEPSETAGAALPLGAIYALRETRPPQTDGIEQPNVVDAALLMRMNAYRPRLVVAMEQRQHYLQFAALIAAKAGIFFLNRPLDFTAMPKLIARLEAHWARLGLKETAA
ncbi:MAG: AAA family ATPase [Rhizomicrobium sp.]